MRTVKEMRYFKINLYCLKKKLSTVLVLVHLPWSELSEKPKNSGNLAAPVINYGSSGKENTSARKMRAVVQIQIKIRGSQR